MFGASSELATNFTEFGNKSMKLGDNLPNSTRPAAMRSANHTSSTLVERGVGVLEDRRRLRGLLDDKILWPWPLRGPALATTLLGHDTAVLEPIPDRTHKFPQ